MLPLSASILSQLKHIIALAVRQQVGVFHRAKADDTRDFPALGFGQFGIFLRNNLERALLGFVEQIGQFHRLAAARFERFAILAENRAEPDMCQFRIWMRCFRMPFAERGKHLLKMQLLSSVGDVNDFVRMPRFQPVSQRGEIGGGVVETAVALPDERRDAVLQLRDDRQKKDCHRAFAFPRDAFGDQFVHERFEPRIVKAFAQRLIEFHTEPRINGVELHLRQRDHLVPDAQVLRVAALEFDKFLARACPGAG